MIIPILSTKLHKPQPASNVVTRSQLFNVLDRGLNGKCIVVSAPAGFGKTTVITSWLQSSKHAVAWLSLEESDNELSRFLRYLIAALQSIEPHIGQQLLPALQSEQYLPIENVMTMLLNDMTNIEQKAILVLDDYHSIDAPEIDKALTFLVDHLPNNITLVITTREDPQLPLAKYRARAELTELRANDLRFTNTEIHTFLNQIMGLALTENNISALEKRTEGWIASLQMVAISLQRQADKTQFIETLTGSHRYILDYLLEEVLHQQSEETRMFLLQTSILSRFNAELCNAVTETDDSQWVLELLERRNLFIVPLDNERHWYRYHHLFGDLLRGRLQQFITNASDVGDVTLPELHRRSSRWYEENGFEVEAFQHMVAAHDIDEAERLMAGGGIPLYIRGAVLPVVNWLRSLPDTVKNDRPALWVAHAWSQLMSNTSIEPIEQALSAATSALQHNYPTPVSQDLSGQIASIRATLAVNQHDVDTMQRESRRALELLAPDNHAVRLGATWTLGYAAQLQGDRATARQAYHDILAMSDPESGSMYTLAALVSLGQVQELNNQLSNAAETYQQLIDIVGDPPHLIAGEAYLGLARIHYAWNDLVTAEDHAKQGYELARHAPHIDTSASIRVVQARLRLAAGRLNDANALINEVKQFVNAGNFTQQLAPIADVRVQVLLAQGDLAAAQQYTPHASTLSRARVLLAQGDTSAALAILEPYYNRMRERHWADMQLRTSVLLALAYSQQSDYETALLQLAVALRMAAEGGFVRLFLDEGKPMQTLLEYARSQGVEPHEVDRLLTIFPKAARAAVDMLDALSERELEVLHLVAEGLSNREISKRLFVALDTVKGHNRNIYQKLQVKRRTEAVARARELGLI